MKNIGKAISLFLIDGNVQGRIKCTLANWTGVVYKLPRTELEKSRERRDLNQSGVYFLFGHDEENDQDMVYIGQAGFRKNKEGILNRLIEHRNSPDKEYWTNAVVFTTSNNSFGPTEISYLENEFTKLATNANRFIIKNANEPNRGNLTEEKESELLEYVGFSKIAMGALGYKVFEPYLKPLTVENDSLEKEDNFERKLFYKRYSNKSKQFITGACIQTSEGYVVLPGSKVELIDSKKIPVGVKKKREKANIDSEGILQEEVLFSSPSYAAAFLIGAHTNGRAEWKDENGLSLNDIEARETELLNREQI